MVLLYQHSYRVVLLFVVIFCSFEVYAIKSNTDRQKNLVHKAWIRDTFVQTNHRHARMLQLVRPVLVGDLLIQGNKTDGVYAYTPDRGIRKWSFKVKGGVLGGVLVAGPRVFFSGADGFIYSLETKTGRVVWKQYTSAVSSSTPVLRKGRLYFAEANKLSCLKARTGDIVWAYPVPTQPSEFVVEGVATPLVTSRLIYFKTSDGTLIALNQGGKLVWKKRLSHSSDRFTSALSSPVIGKVCLYSAGFESGLYCLNKRNGRVIWRNFTGSHGDILLSGATLFYSTSNGQVLALEQKSGKTIWKHKVLTSIATAPVLYKDLLIYGEYSGALRFLSKKNGKERGRPFFFGSGMSSTPQVSLARSALYFISNYGWLYKMQIL